MPWWGWVIVAYLVVGFVHASIIMFKSASYANVEEPGEDGAIFILIILLRLPLDISMFFSERKLRRNQSATPSR